MAATSIDPHHAGGQPPPSSHYDIAPPGLFNFILLSFFFLRAALGWFLGYLVGFLPFREKKLARLHIKLFLPDVRAGTVTRRVFANAGRVVFESLSLKPLVKNHGRFILCQNWEAVEGWKREDRPIIALTAHTGNWDLLAAYVIARGIPLTTVGREARNRYAQVALQSIRSGYGIETVWRSDRAALKRLMQCLQERRVIAALIDQDTRVESVSVPFFGQAAKTPVSLIRLGKKYNARFVSAFLFKTGWFSYSVFVEQLPDVTNDYEILSEYNRRLESYIRQFPDQWVWFHKRWRTRPDGVTLSSKEYLNKLQAQVLEG